MAGVSQPFVSFVERGLRGWDLATACALASATGSDLSLRLDPGRSVRLRDSGQLALVEFVVARAHPRWECRMEHPVDRDSMRAADLVLIGPDSAIHVEVERSLVDVQAQLRAAQLKRAALQESLSRPVSLVLAVPGTRRTRELLERHRDVMRSSLPEGTASVWRAVRRGLALGGDGVLLLPSPMRQAAALADNREVVPMTSQRVASRRRITGR
jgi:hypothetical protein